MTTKTKPIKEWKDLIKAVGTVADTAASLEISEVQLRRVTRGRASFPPDRAHVLQVLCDMYDVPNPLETAPRARNKDLTPLELLGETLGTDLPISRSELESIRDMYPTEQLVELAESDGTPAKILTAITRILELDD